jgi:hypothetical protein
MMSFGKKKRRTPPGPSIRDPLAVIPLIPPNVEMKHDRQGLLHLRLPLPVKGLKKRLGDWFGCDYTKKFDLDEYGTLYFSLVDGKRTMREIVAAMVKKLGRSRKETEKSVILFTKGLMTRGMIVLQVTPDNQVEAAG